MAKDSEQERYLRSLERRVDAGRRLGRWLLAGLAAALLLSLAAWSAHHAATVLSYARLDAAIRLERSPHDPERLLLFYRPLSGGKVGFRRAEAGRTTELFDRVSAAAGQAEQKFEWRCRGVQAGNVVAVTFRKGWSLWTEELSVPQPPPVPPLGDAVLVGEVVDATSNQPVPGAVVKLIGTRLSARSGPDGRFRLADAPPGAAGIEVTAANFSTEQVERELAPKAETPLRIVLSPGMKQGQIRLVLTWGEKPADLDAHLEGPLPEAERFHIYYRDKGNLKSKEYVNLDVDAQHGNGPETITLLGVLPGVYHYFAHDYTNREETQSSALARSGAEVAVYQGGQARRFRVHGDSQGNLWHVCDIVVSDQGAVVKKVDTYESKRLITRASMVDVVFLLDQGPQMRDGIDDLKAHCGQLAEALQAGGLDCRLAVVPFGSPEGEQRIPAIPLTGDLAAFLQRLQAPPPAGAARPAASNVEALEEALRMEFLPGVEVLFFLITNTPLEQRVKLAAVAAEMKARGIKTIVQADPIEQEAYAPLWQNGGRFRSIAGDDAQAAETSAAAAGTMGIAAESILGTRWSFDPKKGNLADIVSGKGLYGLRTAAHREQFIGRLGGTRESEMAVAEGLAWLARHQAEDGHWGPDCLQGATARCERGDQCSGPGGPYRMALSGLALLAFQAGGHYYFNDHKYSEVVRRGLDWLVRHQGPDGELCEGALGAGEVPGPVRPQGRTKAARQPGPARANLPTNRTYHTYFMYEHGMATFALAEACATARASEQEPENKYFTGLKNAVRFLGVQQHADGGWRYTTNKSEPCDSSVTGWQVLALKSAREADIAVSSKTLGALEGFFKRLQDPAQGTTGYTNRGSGSAAMMGVGILVHSFLLKTPDSELVRNAARTLAGQVEVHRSADFYALYNCTLAMHQAGGAAWEKWNESIRDAVINRQLRDRCARGSWEPATGWDTAGGRIYTTALGVLTLEVYYRFSKDSKAASPAGADAGEKTDGGGPAKKMPAEK
jgi:hypothetical protein